jgi:hypothetical protein
MSIMTKAKIVLTQMVAGLAMTGLSNSYRKNRSIQVNSFLKKSLLDRPFKNPKCKERKKFKVDA